MMCAETLKPKTERYCEMNHFNELKFGTVFSKWKSFMCSSLTVSCEMSKMQQ